MKHTILIGAQGYSLHAHDRHTHVVVGRLDYDAAQKAAEAIEKAEDRAAAVAQLGVRHRGGFFARKPLSWHTSSAAAAEAAVEWRARAEGFVDVEVLDTVRCANG